VAISEVKPESEGTGAQGGSTRAAPARPAAPPVRAPAPWAPAIEEMRQAEKA
jgi:hypothetical protein